MSEVTSQTGTQSSLTISILSPLRTVINQARGSKLLLTGSEGQIEILPGHVNIVGNLETGVFRLFHSDGKVSVGVISSGFFEVHKNQVTLVAETLELEKEIDIERAKIAEKKARERLQAGKMDADNFRKHQLKLQRALVRQQIASRSLH